jgi:hypothetical protein
MGASFCIGQSFEPVDRVLSTALITYGIPASLYLDHGKIFVSERWIRAGAKLGFEVKHPPVGDPAPRGKIERFFRTVRDRFLDLYLARCGSKQPTIQELDAAFQEWLRTDYNHQVHSVTHQPPHDRLMAGLTKITIRRKSAEVILRAFMEREERKVSKDALISLWNKKFEVPGEYIGQRILIQFSEDNKETALIIDPKQKEPVVIHLVNRKANSILPNIKFNQKNK